MIRCCAGQKFSPDQNFRDTQHYVARALAPLLASFYVSHVKVLG